MSIPDVVLDTLTFFNHLLGQAAVLINRFLGEVRCIIRIHQAAVVFLGITLGQHERLGSTPYGIDASKIEASIKSVVATACEEEPTAVLTPCMQTL